ncbi:MAG: hypothetical protein K2P63_08255 [Lachnospiraceae bacterium]|nr:hypothetical protein [Lachnospiraceae bacterium]
MIKKMTTKSWISSLLPLLFCGGMAAFFLIKFGPAAIQALQGYKPELARTQSMTNIYGFNALGLFFLTVDVFVVIRMLTHSVGKCIRDYLAQNTTVTQQQLESDFDASEYIGRNLWIGRQWTFCYDMNHIPVENSKIVLVYNEVHRVKQNVTYYICLGLVDGTVERAPVKEKDITRIKEVYARYSHILVGNNSEYQHLFKNDRNALLDIKYRNNHS